MKKIQITILIISLLVLRLESQAQQRVDVLIQNTNIIDVEHGKTIRGRDVMIIGDKIVKISRSSKSSVQSKKIIDGRGKYVIPGLWDMHTHNWWQIHFSDLYVTNGILGVRNMYTPMSFIKPLKDSIKSNLIHGPEYYAAGRVIEGPDPDYPDWIVVDSISKVKAALDTLQFEGSDFVKVYNKIPRDVYFELMKEAQKRGLSVQGHLPMTVTAIEASNAGQKSFEHLLGIPDLCTHTPLFANKHNNNWYAAVLHENDYGTMKIDEILTSKAFSVLRKNKTYVCPTLTVWYNLLHPDTAFEKDTVLNLLPSEISSFWLSTINRHRLKDSAYKQMALRKYETLKKTTYLLYKHGVPLLAGTDAMNPYCYPGISLHRELALLRECGIPNSEILKIATFNAATFLNLKDYGLIKEGYMASLIVLNANPLIDIKNTKQINTVILKGIVTKE